VQPRGSLTNRLHEHALPAPPVKFAIENLLPRAKFQFAIGYRDNDLTAHDLSFEMRVGIVLTRSIVLILADRLVRGRLFQPDFVIAQ